MHFVKTKGIISGENNINLYRGCTHGCIYCDSRSVCYRMEHDFEDVEVKENSLELLEAALRSKRRKCMIGIGSMSDPYQTIEKDLEFTRGALKLIKKYGFGITLITKSDLVLRDLDILKEINKTSKAVVQITLTTADDDLCQKLEPNVCPTSKRVEALKKLHNAGIPTVVWLTPILPFINDTKDNISTLLDFCIEAKVYGIVSFGMGLTLRDGNREFYYKNLDALFPGLKEKYIRIYGKKYELLSGNNKQLMEFFTKTTSIHGIENDPEKIFTYLKTPNDSADDGQLSLFD